MKILSVNCGSSTLKFRLYDMPSEEVLTKGSFERIGSSDSDYTIRVNGEKIYCKTRIHDHGDAASILLEELIEKKIIQSLDEIAAVGHRIVHGGNKYSSSTLITDRVISELESISDLAPLHNPAALIGIKTFKAQIPNAKMIACFDTAFHQTIKEVDYLYPVPYEWYIKYDIRKYGFHGLSHQYVSLKMKEQLKKNHLNLIVCHIGNGASISAIKDGICIDTSMGFTPNAGIMMGTRCGDIDYSIIGYIMEKTGMTYDEVDKILNKASGLEGITGMSDLRDIYRAYIARENRVVLAMGMYSSRIADYIAKYYLRLNGKVDAICFTAGGGENDSIIRAEVLKKIAPLGVVLDENRNKKAIVRQGIEGVITKKESSIPCYVVATDEELMIAKDTYEVMMAK